MIEQMEQLVKEAMKKAGYETEVHIIKSNRPDLCDYQCDDCFMLAKQYHESPMAIGKKVEEELKRLPNHTFYFQNVEFLSPGFLNLTLTDQAINRFLNQMLEEEKFGLSFPHKHETYFLDYGGPNVAKPLHVGHLRSAVVGESIKRILQYAGEKTVSDVHLGDYGLQIGQVIYGSLQDGKKETDLTLAYLEELYPRISSLCKEEETVKEECARITKELQDGNPLYQKYWNVILELSGNDIKRLYRYLDVSFDVWKGESDAYPYIEALKKELLEKQLLEKSEGALIVPLEDLPPLIFEKSNGAYLYGTTDLATIYERERDYHPDHYLYIADLRQSLHFKQLFMTTKKAGLSSATFEFCGFGTVNGMDGKPFKTRKGDAPKLDRLFAQVKEIFIAKKESNQEMSEENIDKIVNAILKFADLQNNRERNYLFDLAKFSEVVGKTGPYVLYTYVRIQKLLESSFPSQFSDVIYNEVDRKLRLKLLELELAYQKSFTDRMPHYLADFIYDLCVEANNFYQNNRLNGLKENQKQQWLTLLNLTNRVLKEMLSLLVIEVPTEM